MTLLKHFIREGEAMIAGEEQGSGKGSACLSFNVGETWAQLKRSDLGWGRGRLQLQERKMKRLKEMFEKGYGIQGKVGGAPFILFIIKYDYLLKEPQIRRQKKNLTESCQLPMVLTFCWDFFLSSKYIYIFEVFFWTIVDLQCCVSSDVQNSDSVLCIYTYNT